MSRETHIDATYGWHRFETKSLRFTITDDADAAVDLDGLSLQWLLLRQAGDAESRAYMNKTSSSGITIVDDANDNIAVVSIDDSEYDDVPSGVYYYELWDRSNDVMLAYGDAWLLPGTKDEA